MKIIGVRQALRSGTPRRTHKHRHVKGRFLLTASFRDASIDMSTVALVGALVNYFTYSQIADMIGCSVSKVGKLNRIYEANQ